MQNDFVPVHLKEANAKLDKHVLAKRKEKEDNYFPRDISLWQKILKLFK